MNAIEKLNVEACHQRPKNIIKRQKSDKQYWYQRYHNSKSTSKSKLRDSTVMNFSTITCETINSMPSHGNWKKNVISPFDCPLREVYTSILLYIITHFGIYHVIRAKLYDWYTKSQSEGQNARQCFMFIITASHWLKINSLNKHNTCAQ